MLYFSMGLQVFRKVTKSTERYRRGTPTREDSIQVEFIRFAYDIEKAATAIMQSPLPNELADRLRKAY